MSYKPQKQNNNSELMRYAGLATQFFVGLGIAVFAGYKIDKWMSTPIPLLVWVLPFVVLVMMIYKLVKDTSKRKKENEKI